jgi:hypothetical protein
MLSVMLLLQQDVTMSIMKGRRPSSMLSVMLLLQQDVTMSKLEQVHKWVLLLKYCRE